MSALSALEKRLTALVPPTTEASAPPDQRSLFELLAETAATTLAALSASACFPRAAARLRCALSLVLLHTGVTLGPALLPLSGWLLGRGVSGQWSQLLLPAVLVALVPHAPIFR